MGTTQPQPLTRAAKAELRHQLVPSVRLLVDALRLCGMTRQEAAKAVRWAAHVVEHNRGSMGQDNEPVLTVESLNPDHLVGLTLQWQQEEETSGD